MTMPYDPLLGTTEAGALDRPADRPVEAAGKHGVLPATERGKDSGRSDALRELEGGSARPLSDEEREAAERDHPPGERVYAPASERVPRDPIPGHAEIVSEIDESTPERRAVHDH